MQRRAFLKSLGGAVAAGLLIDHPLTVWAQTPALPGVPRTEARLTISPEEALNSLPLDYTGISCETAQLSDPEYFAASNTGLVALCRRLSPHGVLRLGGNSSEFCWWQATPGAAPPVIHAAGVGRADNFMPQSLHAVTPRAIDNLAGFLDATGWNAIYGLNFGTGSPERDATEAAYVARALGRRLKYFQIGNEPDFYSQSNNLLRPAGWGFDDYLIEWTRIADAVTARVPNARFGGPDVGASSDWVTRFAEAAPARVPGRLVALSGHYYAVGPPDNPSATSERLLSSGPGVARRMREIQAACRSAGLEYHMTEGNSCNRGGKPGMSNALASSLWGGDYMLEMGSLGCKGINLHTGSGTMISTSLGGKLPGAVTDSDKALAKLGSFYSPLAGSRAAGFTARPLFYGMMLAEQFAGRTLVGAQLDAGALNATAYAARDGGGYRIALFNKDAASDLTVRIDAGSQKLGSGTLWRLTGPSLDATTGITLAGAAVGPDGAWRPAQIERVTAQGGMITVSVPRASAAILFLKSA